MRSDRKLKPLYQQYIKFANEGARDYGFPSAKELWLSGYDMPPDEFPA